MVFVLRLKYTKVYCIYLAISEANWLKGILFRDIRMKGAECKFSLFQIW